MNLFYSFFQKISLVVFSETNPLGRQETSPVCSCLGDWICVSTERIFTGRKKIDLLLKTLGRVTQVNKCTTLRIMLRTSKVINKWWLVFPAA